MKSLFSLSQRVFHRICSSRITKFLREKEEGASLVEYGLLVGLIAVICLGAIQLLGQDISSMFSRIAVALSGL